MWILASHRTIAPTLLLAACSLSAATCAQPAEPETVAAEPQAQVADASAQPPSSPTGAAGDTDLSQLSADVRDCLSDNALDLGQGQTFYEAARVRGENGTYVWIQIGPASPESTEGFKPSILRFNGESCESLLDADGRFYQPEEVVSQPTYDQLTSAVLDWLIERSGGPEAYAEHTRRAIEANGAGRFQECAAGGPPPDEIADCTSSEEAALLRAKGVPVPSP